MIVYCDTSFLVSLLYEGDANHKAARNLAGRFDGQECVLCQTHQLELPASVRAATHRTESPIPGHVARIIINRFDRAWNGRTFARRVIETQTTEIEQSRRVNLRLLARVTT